MAAGEVPPYHELLWPVLQAVGELGGSGSISEIVETAIKREGFSDAQQAVLHNDGPETEIAYRLAWARTYLKGMGLLTNSSRGVWALTDEGTALLTDPSSTDDQRRERIQELRARYLTDLREARKARPPQENGEPDDGHPSAERDWKEQLLEQLMGMSPDAFERLAKRLLREADFDSVNVTGQSVMAASTDLVSTGSDSSAFRSSSSASVTAAASGQVPYATSAARWREEAIRAF